MKKRFFAAAMILTASAMSVNAVDYPGGTQTATIDVSIAPSFTVSIPADTTVAFNAVETDFGKITLESARLEPNTSIFVTLRTDYSLSNALDTKKQIPYSVTGNNGGEWFDVRGFNLELANAGDSYDLKINITQEDWNAAFAGDYSDQVIFTVSYNGTV